jgi:hypothetical protein
MNALKMRLSSFEGGRVKLYVDGRLLVSTPSQQDVYHIEVWPSLRSEDRGELSPLRFRQVENAASGEYHSGTPGEPG